MRSIIRVTAVASVVAFAAGAAIAQQQPSRSVDDYLCMFAGECGEEADEPEVTRDAPDTKGFRMVRERAEAAPAQRSATPRNRTTARTGAALGARSAAAAAPTRAQRQAAQSQRRASPTGTAVNRAASAARATAPTNRADLRLSFELGSAEMTSQAREEARVFAEALLTSSLASRRFRIEGHTDSIGNRDFNLDLSERRARAVADYLQSLGVAADRIEVRGFGYDQPLPGRSARAPENRRVEAVVIS